MNRAVIYVDETKAKTYLLVAVRLPDAALLTARARLGRLILPGQRSLHMKSERASRRSELANVVSGLADLGATAHIFDAGRTGNERERRDRCLRALVASAAPEDIAELVLDLDRHAVRGDRQCIVDLVKARPKPDTLSYRHLGRHEDILLAAPNAVAWCWARGGPWRRRVAPLVTDASPV